MAVPVPSVKRLAMLGGFAYPTGPAQDLKTCLDALSANSAALDYKASCRAATIAPLAAYTRSGNVITKDAPNGALAAVDGVTLVVGDRVLLKNGAAGEDNGIYTVTRTSGSSRWQLTRATDADTSAQVTCGLYTEIEEGSLAGSAWMLTTANPITLNTTSLAFAQYAGAINRVDGTISTQAAGDTAAAGTSIKVAAADHKHAMPAADAAQGTASFRTINASSVTITTAAPSDAATAGAAVVPAAADHKHGMPATWPPTAHAAAHATGADVIPAAVAGVSPGLLSAADKTKLDSVVSIVYLYAGNGADGACVFADTGAGNPAGTTVTDATPGSTKIRLDRDLYGTTIVVAATVEVSANGFRLNAKTSFVNNGTIKANGVVGVAGGAGGTAGATGGGTAGGAEQAADAAGNAGTTGDPAVGGAGGAGGDSGGGRAGGAGGTVTLNAGRGGIRQLPQAALGTLFGATGVAMAKGGTGGGSGGSGGGGSTGGTGGGGGGVIVIVSPSITNSATGTIQANGGAGKAGGGAAGGGGGGGGGGLILLVADTYTNAGTVQASGGTFGAGAGTGAVGVAGSDGTIIAVTA